VSRAADDGLPRGMDHAAICTVGKEVNIPILSHTTRKGWGTLLTYRLLGGEIGVTKNEQQGENPDYWTYLSELSGSHLHQRVGD
jgi:hydrogenase maturation factor HypE